MKLGRRPIPIEKKYIRNESGCWPWIGFIKPSGYGEIWRRGRHQKAHRVIFEMIRGHIPERMQIDHLCRVRHCVNPDHMEVVTQKVNILRGVSFSAENARKTHCAKGHPYNEENTKIYHMGWRRCGICKRRWDSQRRTKARLAKPQVKG